MTDSEFKKTWFLITAILSNPVLPHFILPNTAVNLHICPTHLFSLLACLLLSTKADIRVFWGYKLNR